MLMIVGLFIKFWKISILIYKNKKIMSLENKINELEKKVESLSKKLEDSNKYSEYLAENLNMNISYSEYLAERVNTLVKDSGDFENEDEI